MIFETSLDFAHSLVGQSALELGNSRVLAAVFVEICDGRWARQALVRGICWAELLSDNVCYFDHRSSWERSIFKAKPLCWPEKAALAMDTFAIKWRCAVQFCTTSTSTWKSVQFRAGLMHFRARSTARKYISIFLSVVEHPSLLSRGFSP